MTRVALVDAAAINAPPRRRPTADEDISFLPMSDVDVDGRTGSGRLRPFGEVSKGYTLFERGDVLVAKITPCFENGKIAQAATTSDVAAGSTEFHVVRPLAGVADPRYILHFLRHPHVRSAGQQRMTGSGGQRRVPEAFLRDLQLLLPPLEEQRRIAAVLDHADELRAKRQTSLALLDSFNEAIFLDLVDGSASLSTPIATLAAERRHAIRTGPFGSQLLHSEFVDAGVAVLGIDNAVHDRFVWAKPRFITPEKFEQLRRYQVHPGDVLITIMGTCGRCAVVPDDVPVAINTKHLCCISLDTERCLPEFLWSCIKYHPGVRRQLGATARGAVMPGLNMGLIKSAEVPLPPLEVQLEFNRRLTEARKLAQVLVDSAEVVEDLFSSLQHRAFTGQL